MPLVFHLILSDLYTHTYLGAVLALEDIAGAVGFVSDQAAEAAGLLAVVN